MKRKTPVVNEFCRKRVQERNQGGGAGKAFLRGFRKKGDLNISN